MSQSRITFIVILSIGALIRFATEASLSNLTGLGANIAGLPRTLDVMAVVFLAAIAAHLLAKSSDAVPFAYAAAIFIATRWFLAVFGGGTNNIVLLAYYAMAVIGFALLFEIIVSSLPRNAQLKVNESEDNTRPPRID